MTPRRRTLRRTDLPRVMREAVVGLVRTEDRDPSLHQFGVFLVVYLSEGPHTVRGLAGALAVNKPAITRALDVLCGMGLAVRRTDPSDRRSAQIERTRQGRLYVRDLGGIASEARGTVLRALNGAG